MSNDMDLLLVYLTIWHLIQMLHVASGLLLSNLSYFNTVSKNNYFINFKQI